MDFLRQGRYVIPTFLLLIMALSAGYLDGRFTFAQVEDAREWVDRRWNAFSTYISCLIVLGGCAITGAFVLGCSPGVRWWFGAVLGLGGICLYMARVTWKEAMGMIEFHAHRVAGGAIPKPPPIDRQSAN